MKLLKKEILFQSDIEKLIGKRPFKEQDSFRSLKQEINKKEESEEIKEDTDYNKTNEKITDQTEE